MKGKAISIMLGVFVVAPFLGWQFLRMNSQDKSIARYNKCSSYLQAGGMSTNTVQRLPRQFSDLTVDGYVYVTPRPKGNWILFETWRGKGGNLQGYLFTAGEQLALNDQIEVVRMRPGRLAKSNVIVLTKQGDSWYSVTWGMD